MARSNFRRTFAAAAQSVTALAVATGATLTAEVMWAARRNLPVGDEVNLSGVLGAHLDGAVVRVVVLGDSSLTAPGLTSPDDVWVRRALLALDLRRPVELVSFAAGGSRIKDVREQLSAATEQQTDAVIMSVGANCAIHGTSKREFTRDYQQLLREILTSVPVAAITNVGDLGNIARFPPPLRQIIRQRGRSFGRVIERVASTDERVVLLDVTPSDHFFRDHSLFGADLFHPTSDGHKHWADAVTPGLVATLALLGVIDATGAAT